MNSVTHDRVIQLAMGFWASKVLLSAVELGLFGAFNDGPLDVTELRIRTGLHERAAHDFFDALVALGLLQRNDTGRYSNTVEADLYLNPARPGYMAAGGPQGSPDPYLGGMRLLAISIGKPSASATSIMPAPPWLTTMSHHGRSKECRMNLSRWTLPGCGGNARVSIAGPRVATT